MNVNREALKTVLFSHRKGMSKAQRRLPVKSVSWLYPWAIERHYSAVIRVWLKPMMDFVAEYIGNNEEAILRGDSSALIRTDAVPGGSFRRMVASLNGWLALYLPEPGEDGKLNAPPIVYMGLGRIAESTAEFNATQWDKSAKAAIGVEFAVYENWWPEAKKTWADKNYSLIRSMASDYIGKVNQRTEMAVMNGWSPKQLAQEILKVNTSIKQSKANLIARDQIGKLNGQITQSRMEAVGLNLYEWSTSGDERVRASHTALEGKICRWDDSTVYTEDGGKTWKGRPASWCQLHPGYDISCRCCALSYWDELVGEVDSLIDKEAWEKEHPGEVYQKPVEQKKQEKAMKENESEKKTFKTLTKEDLEKFANTESWDLAKMYSIEELRDYRDQIEAMNIDRSEKYRQQMKLNAAIDRKLDDLQKSQEPKKLKGEISLEASEEIIKRLEKLSSAEAFKEINAMSDGELVSVWKESIMTSNSYGTRWNLREMAETKLVNRGVRLPIEEMANMPYTEKKDVNKIANLFDNIYSDDTDKWWDTLTKDDQKSVREYTKPLEYININKYARGERTQPDGRPVSPQTLEDARKHVEALDRSLQTFELRRDFTFQRLDDITYYKDWNVGTVHTINHFTSSSAGIVEDFYGKSRENVHIEIHVPKGNFGAYIDGKSVIAAEKEFLLQRGLKYEVLEVIPEGGYKGTTRIVVKVIP